MITINWYCDHCQKEAPPTQLDRSDLSAKEALRLIPYHPEWVPDGWILVPLMPVKESAFGAACSLECARMVRNKLDEDPGYLYRDGLRRALERIKERR